MSQQNINKLKQELATLKKKNREEERIKAFEHRKKEKVLITKIESMEAVIIKTYSDKTNEFLQGKITKDELEEFARKNNLIKLKGDEENA